MQSNASEETRDALRIQVAAVVAQQAAVTEQEIRLDEARTQFIDSQRGLMADVESVLLHILAQEEHLERVQADVRSREAFVARLENACTRLMREIDLVQSSLQAESRPAVPRMRAA